MPDAGVGDTQQDPPPFGRDSHGHITARWRVPDRVVDQVADEQREVARGAAHARHRLGLQLQTDLVLQRHVLEPFDLVGGQGVQVDVVAELAARFEP